MKVIDTEFNGLKTLSFILHSDLRGDFCKVYEQSVLTESTIDFEVKESYYSISKAGVVRGMHFQYPPADHDKIVYVPKGRIYDVSIDLRKSEPTYGQYFSIELSDSNNYGMLIPAGFAHGFQALEDDTMTTYLLTSEYSADLDDGVNYKSLGIPWPMEVTYVSNRDKEFVPFKDFKSPF